MFTVDYNNEKLCLLLEDGTNNFVCIDGEYKFKILVN